MTEGAQSAFASMPWNSAQNMKRTDALCSGMQLHFRRTIITEQLVARLQRFAGLRFGGSPITAYLELNARHLLIRCLQRRAEQDKGESRKNSTAHHDIDMLNNKSFTTPSCLYSEGIRAPMLLLCRNLRSPAPNKDQRRDRAERAVPPPACCSR